MFADIVSIAVAAAGVGLLALAIRQARAKGAAAALQMGAGGALLIGASAIGVVEFLVGVVLSPLGWIGIGFLALAGVLFVVGQKLEGRSPRGTKSVEQSPEAKAGTSRGAVTESPKQPKAAPKADAKKSGDDDFSDIEALLRKHGIE